MRRKILMGVLALALPVGSLFALQTAASAKTVVPPDPARSCNAAGTVTFASPGLSKTGTVTTAKDSYTNASIHWVGCTGSGPAVSIKSKNTKCLGPNSPAGTACLVKKTLVYDTESGFANTGVSSISKSLKKLTYVVDGVTYSTKTTGAFSIVCHAPANIGTSGSNIETGFKVSGTVKSPKQDKGQITTFNACLGTDTDTGAGATGSFTFDLGSGAGVIPSAAIDGSTSTLTIS